MVRCRLAFCLQGLRLRRLGEHHPELARHAEPQFTIFRKVARIGRTG